MLTDSPATRDMRSRSLADTGGSAVRTNTAASMVSRAISASAMMRIDERPGVSTSSTPRERGSVYGDGHRREAAAVAGIAAFGNKVVQRGQRKRFGPAVAKHRRHGFVRPVSH